MYIYHCDYCNQTFNFEKRNQPGAHRRNCKLNPNKGFIQKKIQEVKKLVTEERSLTCLKCGHCYSITVTERAFVKGKYRKYCSRKCANSRAWTIEDNIKRSLKLRNRGIESRKFKDVVQQVRECEVCKESFKCRSDSSKRFCSPKCVGSYRGILSNQNRITRSKQEIELFELIRNKYPEAKSNFIIAKGWDADIVLEQEKIAILWNGPWHYKEMGLSNHSLKQVQNRDRIKKDLFKNLGWKVFIFEDRYYSPKQAFEEIFNITV